MSRPFGLSFHVFFPRQTARGSPIQSRRCFQKIIWQFSDEPILPCVVDKPTTDLRVFFRARVQSVPQFASRAGTEYVP